MRNLVLSLLLFASLSASAQTPSAPGSTPALEKVGFVDIEYVLSQLPEMKAMEQKLVEVNTKLGEDFTTRQENYKKVFGDYSARWELLDDSAKMKANAYIGQLQAELQGFNAEAQKTLDNTRKLYMAPIYLKIGRAIAEVAIENGFIILIPKGIENNDFVLWGDPRVDASELLIKKMTAVPVPQTPEKTAPEKKKN